MFTYRSGAHPHTEVADVEYGYEVILPKGEKPMPRVLEAQLALMAHLAMAGPYATARSWFGRTLALAPPDAHSGDAAGPLVEVTGSLN